jgi:hypothetical protein
MQKPPGTNIMMVAVRIHGGAITHRSRNQMTGCFITTPFAEDVAEDDGARQTQYYAYWAVEGTVAAGFAHANA